MESLKKILLFAAFVVLCACEKVDPEPTTGTISGMVTHSENGSPIEGVNIETLPSTTSVVSDSEGKYLLTEVSPGQYRIIGAKEDYISDTLEKSVTAGLTTTADLSLAPVINSPNPAENNSPIPGAVDQPISILLDWSSPDEEENTLTYEILFDTLNPPVKSLVEDYEGTDFQIDNLEYGTTYYWQVITKNRQGGVTAGEVWEFTTTASADPVDIFAMDFENGIGDWNVDNGLWEVGTATAGPDVAHSGQQVAGTILGGDYSNDANTRLISPSILLPGIQSGEKIQLKFWHWYQFGIGDNGIVQISVNGGEWETVSDPAFDGSSPVWTQHVVDLSTYEGSNIRLAFYFTSNALWENNGWYVDDISVEKKVAILNSPEDFELGVGDWSADNGLWEVGEATVGPETAHSGQLVAGTVLGGEYFNDANTRLISPPITLPDVQGEEIIQLKFWHWYQFGIGDNGLVQISVDGGGWETVSDPAFDGSSTVWTQHIVDLSAYTGSNVRIAFYFTSNSLWENNGWYVDDVSLETN